MERINRLKTDLMETISHEARTPLAVLSSYAGLVAMELKDKGADAQTTADLDTIAFEAKRAANLIDSMKKLTLHREESAKRVCLDLAELIRQTSGLYGHIFDRKKVSFILRLQDGLPIVFGSPEELTQVVLNLLQNAKNHTDQGSVTITAQAEDGKITVRITDTGTGIPPGLLPRVFDRGVTGDSGGTGLGLAICQEVIQPHGGTIEIESEPEKGTAVTFTLPVYREDERGA